MSQPSKEQIARFVECFDTLGQFEAMIHLVRGQTAFRDSDWPEMPDPAVMVVKEWLCDLAGIEPKHV